MSKRCNPVTFEDWVEEEDVRGPGFRAEIEARALAKIQGLDLWEQLLSARKRQGVTQREVAHRMGTEQSYVARLERKVRNRDCDDITAGTLMRYASAVGATLSVKGP